MTMMDMQYNYTAGANNGRIASSVDWVAGETVNYTYDALNRLSGAGATSGSWGQGFSYDGFGNLTGKTVTAGTRAFDEREFRSGRRTGRWGRVTMRMGIRRAGRFSGRCTTWRIGW